ncbi:hypothetical protein Tco_0514311 [Tanacetum coccineum]
MDPTSSLRRIFLGENVYGKPSEKVEGHGDWDAPEYMDTAGSKEKKVTKALSFFSKWKRTKMITEEEEKAIIKVKGEALKEEDDLGAFIFPIRFEGKVNQHGLADTGSDINTMPYQIYEKLGREEIKKVEVTTIIAKFLILDIPIDRDAPIVNNPERLFSTFDGICHQTFRAARSDVLKTAERKKTQKKR